MLTIMRSMNAKRLQAGATDQESSSLSLATSACSVPGVSKRSAQRAANHQQPASRYLLAFLHMIALQRRSLSTTPAAGAQAG